MITDPALVARLTMDDTAWRALMTESFRAVGRRRCTPRALATALGYPWERPTGSYRLEADGAVTSLGALPAAARTPGGERIGLLAVGSNGAPATLARKLAHLPPGERRVLVVAGALEGFDVGAAAHPTAYGAMAATPFESPGTAVRAAVLWVSPAALTALTWTEISYRLGRLDGIRFTPDVAVAPVAEAWMYASRWGTFCPGGAPVAQAALPAQGRTAPAHSQAELLGLAARTGLGAAADGEDVVRAVFADVAAFTAGPGARIAATGRAFAPTSFTPWAP